MYRDAHAYLMRFEANATHMGHHRTHSVRRKGAEAVAIYSTFTCKIRCDKRSQRRIDWVIETAARERHAKMWKSIFDPIYFGVESATMASTVSPTTLPAKIRMENCCEFVSSNISYEIDRLIRIRISMDV